MLQHHFFEQDSHFCKTLNESMVLCNPTNLFRVLMPSDLAQDIQSLEESTGLSRGEIFRRAISLYKLANQTKADGGSVILRDQKGEKEVIGI